MSTQVAVPKMQSTLAPADLQLLTRGWEVLVEKLGYAHATRFVMLLDTGSGDAVEYFRALWQDTSAAEIYEQMLARRKRLKV